MILPRRCSERPICLSKTKISSIFGSTDSEIADIVVKNCRKWTERSSLATTWPGDLRVMRLKISSKILMRTGTNSGQGHDVTKKEHLNEECLQQR